MASGIFVLLKTILQQALAEKTIIITMTAGILIVCIYCQCVVARLCGISVAILFFYYIKLKSPSCPVCLSCPVRTFLVGRYLGRLCIYQPSGPLSKR